MNVKIISTNNFQSTYVLLNEHAGLLDMLDENGDFVQIKKNKLEIDSITEVAATEAYKTISNHQILDNILKARCSNVINSLENELGVKLESVSNSNTCYHDKENDTVATILYSAFDHRKNSCEIEIFDYQLNSMKEGMRELVVLVLEEFGTFYIDGQKLRNYFSNQKPTMRKGKKFWSLSVNYDELIHVPGGPAFNDYSNDISFVKNFTFSNEQYSNVTSLDAVRTVQQMQKDIKTKRNGYKVSRKSA